MDGLTFCLTSEAFCFLDFSTLDADDDDDPHHHRNESKLASFCLAHLSFLPLTFPLLTLHLTHLLPSLNLIFSLPDRLLPLDFWQMINFII
jgi:hypothetical protein